ncbi:MAG: vacuolar sorting protein VPS33/slp1 [Trizodia sp. TS-e1964]|nr:MAG: vacuolar sorting protein VPS33/slp1 [Trizodia sp. TS-e1964]
MDTSIIDIQRDILIKALKRTTQGEWKVVILDETSRKLVYNVVKEDDILNENVANIEQIEHRRPTNRDMDAVYILSPQPHIVECVMADLGHRRYRSSSLIWTSFLNTEQRRIFGSSKAAQEQIAGFEELCIDFFPRESHLLTFRDPWSFPILYHPACNPLVRDHMLDLAQKNPMHEANVLCSLLARFVQDELDAYAQHHTDYPPHVNRPRGTLIIADRSMDLTSPILHEFSYQAMVHDLLPIKEGDKVMFKTTVDQGADGELEKDVEIGEKDKLWVENRHRHMLHTIEKLEGDFKRFMEENGHFANNGGGANSLNAIKDMLAGLPQFRELKDAYSLHLTMAQECMNIFQHNKLADIVSVEQSLATGLGDDYRKPKNLADQVVRLLDDESITSTDRLRLIILYILYRDGLIPADIHRLLSHAHLPSQDNEVIQNLELLGARIHKPLKDNKPAKQSIFPPKPPPPPTNGPEILGSRYQPSLKALLDEHGKGSLDQQSFPFTKPQLDDTGGPTGPDALSKASLRSAKPTWASGKASSSVPRQRVIIFLAGGATYSESRACYEVSQSSPRDVYLATSHMLTPGLFLKQVGDLSRERRKLNIPAEQPKPTAPAHLFEKEAPRKVDPPSNELKAVALGSNNSDRGKGSSFDSGRLSSNPPDRKPEKPKKDKDKDPDKKKKRFFSSKK